MIRDFHPLVFFYALGILMTSPAWPRLDRGVLRLNGNAITTPTIVLVALLLTRAPSSRSSRCGSTWSRTKTCAEVGVLQGFLTLLRL